MKKTLLKVVKFAYFFGAMFVFFTGYAHAYIDPSAVTYMIQAIAAVVIAVGAALTVFRHKIAALFKKNKKDADKAEIHFDEAALDDDSKTE